MINALAVLGRNIRNVVQILSNLIAIMGKDNVFVDKEVFVMDVLSTENYVLPNTVTLHGAYPNPFNPSTKIKFELPYVMHVELNILDIQ